jgi:5,5'-dehydrodivanillate O-demethylase
MPNMSSFIGSPKAKHLETGRRHNFMWRVPVDDEHHVVLGTERVRVPADAIDRYHEWRREVDQEQRQVPMDTVARAVLAGQMGSKEIHTARQWDTSSVQDYVVLIGQGVYVDREHEHLGQEDVGIVLLRKIYERELRALAEGRPLKAWALPSA